MDFDDNKEEKKQETPGTTPPAPVGEQQDAPNQYDLLLKDIVGVDGNQKYRDVETALSALTHSQTYIKELEEKLKTAEEKANKNVSVEQVLDILKQNTEQPKTEQTPSGLSAEDVVKLLDSREREKAKRANIDVARNKLLEAYGEKASEVYKAKIAELGLTPEYVDGIASTSPKAFFTMFGLEDKKPVGSPLPSGINTSAMTTPPNTQPKSVMGLGSTKDVVDNWKRIEQEINAKYNS